MANVNTLTEEKQYKTVGVISDVSDKDGSYYFTAVVNTNAVDREKEVVKPDGLILTDWEKSGFLSWMHDYEGQPVGLNDITKPIERDGNRIILHGKFLERPSDYQGEFRADFARAFVTQAVKAGLSPCVSIGYIPLERRKATKKDKQEYGDEVESVVTRGRVFEFGIAPAASNSTAYVTAIGKGLMTLESAKFAGIDIPVVPPVYPSEPEKLPLTQAKSVGATKEEPVAAVKAITITNVVPETPVTPTKVVPQPVPQPVTKSIHQVYGRKQIIEHKPDPREQARMLAREVTKAIYRAYGKIYLPEDF